MALSAISLRDSSRSSFVLVYFGPLGGAALGPQRNRNTTEHQVGVITFFMGLKVLNQMAQLGFT